MELKKMFSFFKKTGQKIKKEEPSFEIELTASVLAYEIARIDGNISSDELNILMEEIKVISRKVGKKESEDFTLTKFPLGSCRVKRPDTIVTVNQHPSLPA